MSFNVFKEEILVFGNLVLDLSGLDRFLCSKLFLFVLNFVFAAETAGAGRELEERAL